MTDLLQNLIDAVALGALYALLALGVALIFGVGRVINFAQGDYIMVGAYVLVVLAGAAAVVGAFAVAAALVALALMTERGVFRPLRRADPTTLLVAGFAASVLIQNAVLMVAGPRPKSLDFGSALLNPLDVGGLRIPIFDVVTIGLTLSIVVALSAFLSRTLTGTQLRAAAEDFGMARLMGVRANRVIATAFGISGLLAAAASLLLVAQAGAATPTLGVQPVLIAFVATVIGGLGSLSGAAAGGFSLGVVTVGLDAYLPEGAAAYRDALLFTSVIVVLLVRPQGLFPGRGLKERV